VRVSEKRGETLLATGGAWWQGKGHRPRMVVAVQFPIIYDYYFGIVFPLPFLLFPPTMN